MGFANRWLNHIACSLMIIEVKASASNKVRYIYERPGFVVASPPENISYVHY